MELNERKSLDQILEAAVVTSWPNLMPEGNNGLIHVEYDFAAPNGTLNYLQIWSSTRHGYWQLVCTYEVPPSGVCGNGVQFQNGYAADQLAKTLDFVMKHQQAFLLPPNLGRQGLLQITAPAAKERAAAAGVVTQALEQVTSGTADPVMA